MYSICAPDSQTTWSGANEMCSKCGRMRSYSLAGSEARILFPLWLWGSDTSIGAVPLLKHYGRPQLRNDYSRQNSAGRVTSALEKSWARRKDSGDTILIPALNSRFNRQAARQG